MVSAHDGMDETEMTKVFNLDTDAGMYQAQPIGGKAIMIARDAYISSGSSLKEPGKTYTMTATLTDMRSGTPDVLYNRMITYTVDRPRIIDIVAFFVIEDALGFKSAISAGFGESDRLL